MSPWVDAGPGGWRSFPRVSGDEPEKRLMMMQTREFSPRERG